ncbi:hypothetical protein KEM48_001083 [Puccinia striiformis f. sp. tritici PST-130]|nr:hypothetical protein KEM48_001083 [Puccinia striiformis f. sp. tritici PST-130]
MKSGTPHPSSSSKMERYQEQADLVVDGFKGLLSRYDPYSDSLNDRRRTRVHRENADISRPELEKVIFNRLHSSLVPLLGQQIADLSRSLDPTHFQNYSVFAFQLILEVQSKLHQTLNQIESAIETICAHRKQTEVAESMIRIFNTSNYLDWTDCAKLHRRIDAGSCGLFQRVP